MSISLIYKGEELSGGFPNGTDEIYSTEETRIGTWIDGKPLYRLVIASTTPDVVGLWTPIDEADVLDVETVAYLSGVVYVAPTGMWLPLPYGDGTTFASIMRSNASPAIQFYQNYDFASNYPIHITIKYTKTTD